MPFHCAFLVPTLWIAYGMYWWAMAGRVKAAERFEPAGPRLLRLVLMVTAIALLVLPSSPIPTLNARFLPPGSWPFWLGAALTAAGLLFAVWARRCLGTNWSRAVTIKQDHELITTGPYAVVRHPIYTGLLLALLGSAIARAEWRGLLAVLLAFFALYRKLKLEESWMYSQFGASYDAYSHRVGALIPYLLWLPNIIRPLSPAHRASATRPETAAPHAAGQTPARHPE
jgi:protein-S-isoprenylcysteine O-methyltransferase Ste14